MNDEQTRQLMGCGFLEPVEGASPWMAHEGILSRGVEVTVCPRYTTDLPDVVDAAIAYGHTEKGGLASLRVLCGDQSPPSALMRSIEVLGGAVAQLDSFKNEKRMEEAKRNGR